MTPLRRQVEGWQLAVVAVGIALIAAGLAVPRRTDPDVIPLPEPSHAAGVRERARDRARMARASSAGLPYSVRAVGELVRRYGVRSRTGGDAPAHDLLDDLGSAARQAIAAHGEEALLELRAVQTDLFLEAVARWEALGVRSRELDELGGDFVDRALAHGWVKSGRLVLEDAERRAVFQIRWGRLLDVLERHPFSPSLDDWRRYYRALLRHPELDGASPHPQRLARLRLGYVRALERRDPEYPAQLARGILWLELGDHAAAAEALEQFLTTHPNGRWQLRARNHLATALLGASRASPADL